MYSFGGWDDTDTTIIKKEVPYTQECFLRLDTAALNKCWESIILKNPSLVNGFQYGVLPLGFVTTEQGHISDDMIRFLVFGGNDKQLKLLDRTCVFTTRISDFAGSSEFTLLNAQTEQQAKNSEYFNAASVRITPRWNSY